MKMKSMMKHGGLQKLLTVYTEILKIAHSVCHMIRGYRVETVFREVANRLHLHEELAEVL